MVLASVVCLAVGAGDLLAQTQSDRIRYLDILKNPDDISLNFRYARQQVGDGDVKGAAATLERILLLEPDLHRVRLFYAVVLIRLDSLEEAEIELTSLLAVTGLDDATRAEAEGFLEDLKQSQDRFKIDLLATAGIQADTNPLANPSSSSLLVTDLEVDIPGSEDDTAFVAFGRAAVEYDLGYQAGHTLDGSATFAMVDQSQADRLDLVATTLDLGGKYVLGDVTVRPSFLVTDANLADQQYLLALGGAVRADWRVDGDLNLHARVSAADEDFDSISVSRAANLQSGEQFRAEIGARYRLSQSMQARLTLQTVDKNAEASFNAYRLHKVSANHTWIFDQGRFLSSSLGLGLRLFDGPDVFVSSRTRRDETLNAKILLGLPVQSLIPFDVEHKTLDNLLVLVSAEYYRALSNIQNFTYSNARAQALVSKRWRF